ncbi:TRAP transporter small permease [Parasulfitobacter algicola]|uniref:TRAP transporter small permease protein n=1 Tax=Parasulfitobacter algicola TaxID=2614809 RepID=A0ABX2ISC1_9RHOB|nr:TRAP transporter small permease [Sulfitobacter algicola]NSX55440.1 TRAP transporter small permease [Sulfitobacter algicola]
MALLFGLLAPLQLFNDIVLRIGRALAIAALAIMVCIILGQIFFRYLSDGWAFDQVRTYVWAGLPKAALSWTEEGARFLMLWMTGLIAPMAYRYGGFVSIDMLERALPRILAAILGLLLTCIAAIVIIYCVILGWDNVTSFTASGRSGSLELPLDWFGGERIRFKNRWAFASLFVGFCLLLIVNTELLLRQVISLFGGGDNLRPFETTERID